MQSVNGKIQWTNHSSFVYVGASFFHVRNIHVSFHYLTDHHMALLQSTGIKRNATTIHSTCHRCDSRDPTIAIENVHPSDDL